VKPGTMVFLVLATTGLAGCSSMARLYPGWTGSYNTTGRLLAYGRRAARMDADQRKQAYSGLLPLNDKGCSAARVRLGLLELATPPAEVPDKVPNDPLAPCVWGSDVASTPTGDLAAVLRSALAQRKARERHTRALEKQNQHMQEQLDKIKQLERSMQLHSGSGGGSGGP